MTHHTARHAARRLTALAVSLEAGFAPEIIPFEAHLAHLATTAIEAVGHAKAIAAHLAAQIGANPDAGPSLRALGRRLAAVSAVAAPPITTGPCSPHGGCYCAPDSDTNLDLSDAEIDAVLNPKRSAFGAAQAD